MHDLTWTLGATSTLHPSKTTQGAVVTSAITKARADMQRQRVALTHASGRYVPPSSRSMASSSASAYDNPYTPATSRSVHDSHPNHPNYIPPDQRVCGPRLPAPRVPKPLSKPAVTADADPFPGSHLTDPAARAALPGHLKRTQPPKTERFRIDDYKMTKTAPMRDIPRPQVQNFDPDEAGKSRAKVDFFARPQSAAKLKRPVPVDEERNGKRARRDTPDAASASPPAGPPPPHRNSPSPADTPSFLLKKKTNRHSGPQRFATTNVDAVKRAIAKPANRVPRRR